MAEISTFLYCENAQPLPNGGMTINGPMKIITPKYIPGVFSFTIFFGIIGIDLSDPHTLQIKFMKKGENKALVDTDKLNLQNQEIKANILPLDMRGFMANLDFRNVELETEGEYVTKVILDGELKGEFPIKAKAVNNE